MTDVSLSALDLAALLCSRVCHDVISPVGAIVNGLEVLEEEKDDRTESEEKDDDAFDGDGTDALDAGHIAQV